MKDENQAKEILVKMSQQYSPRRNMTVLGFCNTLVELLEGTLRPTTIQLYKQVLSKFAAIVGDHYLKAVQPYHLDLFKARRLKQVSPAKVSIDFRTLRSALNYAVKFRLIDKNPALDCKDVNIPEKEPRFLVKEEFERLLNAIKDSRLRSIVLLAVSTGMRASEIINLRWEDYDPIGGFLHLKNTDDFTLKNKRRRSIPLNKTAKSVLDAIRRESEYIFSNEKKLKRPVSSISSRFKKCVRKAHLPEEIHFHSLRHTAATWLIQQGVPVTYVQRILGHANVSTTLIYTHHAEEHLKHAVQKIDSLILN